MTEAAAFSHWDEASVVELGFFVHRREVAVLEAAASRVGLTIGQLTRQLIRDFIAQHPKRTGHGSDSERPA